MYNEDYFARTNIQTIYKYIFDLYIDNNVYLNYNYWKKCKVSVTVLFFCFKIYVLFTMEVSTYAFGMTNYW